MDSLLNHHRPPVFCPGCAHDQVLHALNQCFQDLRLSGEQIVIVTDIGCSGLFDTFFNTHAFHGLHGRALTYAIGIKMAQPNLHVVVTMGDGGLGIGGAHVISTCRRNIDITLLVLNNFNYGMTGGQCSATTPPDAQVNSGFLNQLEKPIDLSHIAGIAGAGFVTRASTYEKGLVGKLQAAIQYEGFSVIDIMGICPGRFTRRNKITPETINMRLEQLPALDKFIAKNARKEYNRAYREEAAKMDVSPPPVKIEATCLPPQKNRQEVLLLGSAGQRIITAGELLCLSGISAGLNVTQKNDYPITVMRGHSISELILSKSQIDYTGIESPNVIVALAQEGVNRRDKIFSELSEDTLVLKGSDVKLPETCATVREIDFKKNKIKSQDRALAALSLLAVDNRVLNKDMLVSSLKLRFKGKTLEQCMVLINDVNARIEKMG